MAIPELKVISVSGAHTVPDLIRQHSKKRIRIIQLEEPSKDGIPAFLRQALLIISPKTKKYLRAKKGKRVNLVLNGSQRAMINKYPVNEEYLGERLVRRPKTYKSNQMLELFVEE